MPFLIAIRHRESVLRSCLWIIIKGGDANGELSRKTKKYKRIWKTPV